VAEKRWKVTSEGTARAALCSEYVSNASLKTLRVDYPFRILGKMSMVKQMKSKYYK